MHSQYAGNRQGHSYREPKKSFSVRVIIPRGAIFGALSSLGVIAAIVFAGAHMFARQAAPSTPSDNNTTATARTSQTAPEIPYTVVVRYGDENVAPSVAQSVVQSARNFFQPTAERQATATPEQVKAFQQSFPAYRPETAKWLESLRRDLNVESKVGLIIAGVEEMWENGKCGKKGQSAYGFFQYTKGRKKDGTVVGSFVDALGDFKGDPDFLRRAIKAANARRVNENEPRLEEVMDAVTKNAQGHWSVKPGKEDLIERARKHRTINAIAGFYAVEKDIEHIETKYGIKATPEIVWSCRVFSRVRAGKILQAAKKPRTHIEDLKDDEGKILISRQEINANGMLKNAKTVSDLFAYMKQKTYIASAWESAMNAPPGAYKAAATHDVHGRALAASSTRHAILARKNNPPTKLKQASIPVKPSKILALSQARRHTSG